MAVNDIPYRPIFEALILELFIELIRESAIRLPTPIGQTIGIVGGLVIGNAIVDAGLVSNFMVIVVAMTAISSFVVPSWEMNMSIRLIRFPFMIAAALFGFWYGDWNTHSFYPSFESVIIETALFYADCSF